MRLNKVLLPHLRDKIWMRNDDNTDINNIGDE